MAGRSDAFTIAGTVRRDVLDTIHLSHRMCIAANDGHTYEVEPRYLGLYVERFEGRRVVARVHPLPNDNQTNVVRILRLKVLDSDPAEAAAGATCSALPILVENREQAPSFLEVGRTETS
jgi:hypothetical protein